MAIFVKNMELNPVHGILATATIYVEELDLLLEGVILRALKNTSVFKAELPNNMDSSTRASFNANSDLMTKITDSVAAAYLKRSRRSKAYINSLVTRREARKQGKLIHHSLVQSYRGR